MHPGLVLKSDPRFFEKYFGELADETRQDLAEFSHFQAMVNGNLRYEFFTKVFQSAPFRRDFLAYLREHLLADYRAHREKQLRKLFDKWEQLLRQNLCFLSEAVDVIRREIGRASCRERVCLAV